MDSGYRSMFTSFEDVVNRPPPYQWTFSPTAAAPKYFGAAVVRIELVFQIASSWAAIECGLYAGTESIRIRFQTAY